MSTRCWLAACLCLAVFFNLQAKDLNVRKELKGDLVALEGKKLKKFDDAKLAEVKYVAVYYSAHWCGPCRQFTPKLVQWYQGFKSKHADFELVFFSNDTSEESMEEYMDGETMPWPAVRFDKLKSHKLDAFSARGIPFLAVIDVSTGKRVLPSDETLKAENNWAQPTQMLKELEALFP
jgi:nucleoredoxin